MEKDVSEVWSRKRKIAGGSTPEYGVHWAERVLERFPFDAFLVSCYIPKAVGGELLPSPAK